MEGLDARAEYDFLCRDDSESMAAAILQLLRNDSQRDDMASRARKLVEERFGHRIAAKVFEEICLDVLERFRKAGAENKAQAMFKAAPAAVKELEYGK
jgi:hypothetical protein